MALLNHISAHTQISSPRPRLLHGPPETCQIFMSTEFSLYAPGWSFHVDVPQVPVSLHFTPELGLFLLAPSLMCPCQRWPHYPVSLCLDALPLPLPLPSPTIAPSPPRSALRVPIGTE